MPKCWLKTNARPWRVAMIAAALVMAMGAAAAIQGLALGLTSAMLVAGVTMLTLGAIGLATMFFASRLPRLAYEQGELLVYLRSLTPLRVPVDVVECFFLGQGPAHPAPPDAPAPKAANVIARLADSAPHWHARDVRPDLGQWREGYITIHGMWCEPLSHERVNELNRCLQEAHRACRERQEVS